MIKRALNGIDGWLLVFMAALIVTSLVYLLLFMMGLRNTAIMEARYGPLPLEIAISSWVFNLSRILLPLVIFWRMLRIRRWRSAVFAVVGLWILFAGIPLIDWLYAVWTLPQGIPSMVPHVIRELLRGGFFALGGTCYLLASIRVANTYPRADAPELIAKDFE